VQGHSARATSSKRSAWITLVVLLTAAVGLCLLMVWPFAATIIGAAVLAVVYYPLHLRIQNRTTNPRLAALVSTILVLIAFLVPLALLVTTVLQELRAAYQALAPGAAEQGASRIWAALDRPLAAVGTWLGMESSDLRALLAMRLQEAGSAMAGKTIAVLSAAGGGVVKIVIAVGTFYCTFLYGGRVYENAVQFSPLGPQRTETLLSAVREMVMSSFYGVIAVAAAQGFLCGLGAWIAGLPSPALWGVAAAIVSVLPLFGRTRCVHADLGRRIGGHDRQPDPPLGGGGQVAGSPTGSVRRHTGRSGDFRADGYLIRSRDPGRDHGPVSHAPGGNGR
jgi:predicted PurR-regulated permease PerM